MIFQHDHPCLLVQFLDVLVSGNLLLHVPFMQAAQLGAGVVTGAVQYVGMPGKNMVADFPVLGNGLGGVVPAEAILVVQRILIVFDDVLQLALLGVIGGLSCS